MYLKDLVNTAAEKKKKERKTWQATNFCLLVFFMHCFTLGSRTLYKNLKQVKRPVTQQNYDIPTGIISHQSNHRKNWHTGFVHKRYHLQDKSSQVSDKIHRPSLGRKLINKPTGTKHTQHFNALIQSGFSLSSPRNGSSFSANKPRKKHLHA